MGQGESLLVSDLLCGIGMPWLGAMCVNQLFDTVTKYPEKLFKGRKGLFVDPLPPTKPHLLALSAVTTQWVTDVVPSASHHSSVASSARKTSTDKTCGETQY